MPDLIDQLDLEALREKSRRSLYFFIKGVLGYDWLEPSIHGPVCEALEDPSTNRKLVELPRGWLKTTVATIGYPMWRSINSPNIRCLLTQNSATNAMKKLAVIRTQWENNDLLRALFPELLPTSNCVWKADALCLNREASFPEATYEAAGTSTRVVSRHYDLIVEDDTVAPDYDELGQESLAPSAEDVEKAIGWHRTNVLPLMNNPSRDVSVVVGTRWYDQDLIRYVKDNEPQYKVITRACRENERGEPDPKGIITYPQRFDEKTLDELERSLGPYMFNCLYMNSPIRREDMAFKPEWFLYYETSPILSKLAIYTTIDTATDPRLAKSADTDYSVVMTCGKDLSTGIIYVLEYFRKKCSPGEFSSAVIDHVLRWRPVLVGYQDTTIEKSLDYWLKELMRQQGVFFILEPLRLSNKKDAKNQRIGALQPLFHSQTILLRSSMKELESELLKFPFGGHDDLADALSMQLGLWRITRTTSQQKLHNVEDPLNVAVAIEEIRVRRGGRQVVSPIFAPARCSSHDMFMFAGGNN